MIVNCAATGAAINAILTDAGTGSATCRNEPDSDACECDITFFSTVNDDVSYFLDGNTIVTASDRRFDFCVDSAGLRFKEGGTDPVEPGIQLALDAPAAVHSLALLEPALVAVPSGQAFLEAVSPAVESYMAGNAAEAVDRFITVVMNGAPWREETESRLPGSAAQAERDALSRLPYTKQELQAVLDELGQKAKAKNKENPR